MAVGSTPPLFPRTSAYLEECGLDLHTVAADKITETSYGLLMDGPAGREVKISPWPDAVDGKKALNLYREDWRQNWPIIPPQIDPPAPSNTDETETQ